MPSRRKRKAGPSTTAPPAELPSLPFELWEHIFHFLLRVDRLPTLNVCKRWHATSRTDPNLWSFLVVTCDQTVVGGKSAASAQRRLPQTFGEYAQGRVVLEGALPVGLHQLQEIPDANFVETLVFASDWAALPEIADEQQWFDTLQATQCSGDTGVVAG